MSSIFSILRKDLRFLFWPWLGWLGLLLGKLGLGAWCILSDHFGPGDKTSSLRLDLALTGCAAVLCYVLVLRLVQADAPVRARAFWRTRPVSGGQLLVAKTLAAFLLFGLAAVLVSLPWWLVNGFGAGDIAFATCELLLGQAALVLPALLIASLVDSFGRAVLWSIIQGSVLVFLELLFPPVADNPTTAESNLLLSRLVLAAIVVALTLPSLIAWQFNRRRPVAVIAALIVLQASVVAIWRYSPVDLTPRALAWSELRPELARNATLEPATIAEYHYLDIRNTPSSPACFRSRWPIAGLPPALAVETQLTSLRLNEGDATAIRPGNACAWPDAELFAMRGIRHLLGLPASSAPDDVGATLPSVAIFGRVSLEQATRFKQYPPTAAASLRVRLSSLEVFQNQPLTAGLRTKDRHGILRIVRIDENRTVDQTGVRVERVTTGSASRLREIFTDWNAAPGDTLPLLPYHRTSIDLLFDPETGSLRAFYNYHPELRILGVGIHRDELDYAVPQIRRAGKSVPAVSDLAAWRAGLRFARIAYHEESRFLLTGRTEAFLIAGDPEKAQASKP